MSKMKFQLKFSTSLISMKNHIKNFCETFFLKQNIAFSFVIFPLKFNEPLYKAKKKFFKLHLLGTLNLCFKVPEQVQKIALGWENAQKLLENATVGIWTVFGHFLSLEWSHKDSLNSALKIGSKWQFYEVPKWLY